MYRAMIAAALLVTTAVSSPVMAAPLNSPGIDAAHPHVYTGRNNVINRNPSLPNHRSPPPVCGVNTRCDSNGHPNGLIQQPIDWDVRRHEEHWQDQRWQRR